MIDYEVLRFIWLLVSVLLIGLQSLTVSTWGSMLTSCFLGRNDTERRSRDRIALIHS